MKSTVLTSNNTFFPAILFLLAIVAVPVVFIAIAHVGTEGDLLRDTMVVVRAH